VRRLVVEADASEFARVSGDKSIEKIKSLEVLHFIKQDPNEFALICEVEFKQRPTRLDEIFNEPGDELQVLDQSRDGKCVILFKGKPQNDPTAQAFWAAGGYLLTPLEIKNGKVRMTFLGSAKQIRIIPAMFKKMGVQFKVVQVADADSPRNSPLNELTEKQRGVLSAAHKHGYYDIPRRINSKQLAQKLAISSSDLIKHRRKAEGRLLSAVFRGS
jgi:HTH DNA binding domain